MGSRNERVGLTKWYAISEVRAESDDSALLSTRNARTRCVNAYFHRARRDDSHVISLLNTPSHPVAVASTVICLHGFAQDHLLDPIER